jgi:hypothetical protein
MLEVNSDLVSASGIESTQHQAIFARDLNHFVSRTRRSARCHNSHLLTLNRMSPNCASQFTGAMPENSATEREVVFSDLPPGKGTAEPLVGSVIFGDHQATASLPVKTMNDARSELTADPAQIATMKEQPMHQSARCNACAGVNSDTRWFVDYQNSFIFEQNIQWQIFGFEFDENCRWNFDRDLIPGLDQLARTNRLAV